MHTALIASIFFLKSNNGDQMNKIRENILPPEIQPTTRKSVEQGGYPPLIPSSQGEPKVPVIQETTTTSVQPAETQDIQQIIRDEVQKALSEQQQMEPVVKDVEPPATVVNIEDLEPSEWFEHFLNGKPHQYGLKKRTIAILVDRVQLRAGELPQPAQLQGDIVRLQKNMTPEIAAAIAEAYSFEVQKYQDLQRKKAEYWQQPYQGMRVPEAQPTLSYGTIPTQQPPQGWNVPNQYPIPVNPLPSQQQQFYPPGMQPYPQPYPLTFEQQLEGYVRTQGILSKTEERNPAIERLEEDNRELKRALERLAEKRGIQTV